MYYNCIIIGGGASALMLAARLDMNNTPGGGLILEKTGRCGTKLLMSGGGRCNITHGGSIKDFISCYGEAGPRLRKCLYRHSNIDLASWLEENGIPLAGSKGEPVYSWDLSDAGRVFPASHKASDILRLLLEKAGSNGWEIRTDTEVHGIQKCDEGWDVRVSPSDELTAENIVTASGGITFPETGSDGSLFGMLGALGVGITTPRSSLAPVYPEEYPYGELSGITLEDVTAAVFMPSDSCSGGKADDHESGGYRHRNEPDRALKDHGRLAARMTGDLLFTHRGFSGPVILNISRYAGPGSTMSISYGRAMEDLPKRMQKALVSRSRGPSGDIRTSVLAGLLISDDFTISSVDDNGMVTAGGISLDEIDMSTMQLRRFPGLYAIGETIDADGITGGYNLQMCWSTACTAADFLAGKNRSDQ